MNKIFKAKAGHEYHHKNEQNQHYDSCDRMPIGLFLIHLASLNRTDLAVDFTQRIFALFSKVLFRIFSGQGAVAELIDIDNCLQLDVVFLQLDVVFQEFFNLPHIPILRGYKA